MHKLKQVVQSGSFWLPFFKLKFTKECIEIALMHTARKEWLHCQQCTIIYYISRTKWTQLKHFFWDLHKKFGGLQRAPMTLFAMACNCFL